MIVVYLFEKQHKLRKTEAAKFMRGRTANETTLRRGTGRVIIKQSSVNKTEDI